jgi:hypothetical protein
MRADDKARHDVPQHHRLFEPVKQYSDHASHQHDNGQILNEADGMHGRGLLVTNREDARFCRKDGRLLYEKSPARSEKAYQNAGNTPSKGFRRLTPHKNG